MFPVLHPSLDDGGSQVTRCRTGFGILRKLWSHAEAQRRGERRRISVSAPVREHEDLANPDVYCHFAREMPLRRELNRFEICTERLPSTDWKTVVWLNPARVR